MFQDDCMNAPFPENAAHARLLQTWLLLILLDSQRHMGCR